MDIATMGALATKLTDFSVNFLQGVFCESFCEVLDLGKDIVFEAIRTGKINQETAKALEEVDKEVLDNLKAFIGQELKSKKGKIPTKLRGKDLTELFTGRLETVSEMVEKYAIQHNLSEANKLALTYVLGEIKRVTAQAAHKTMGGDEKRLVLVLSQVMENVYSNTKDEITSLLIQTVYTRPVECYNCGNEDLHYDDRMQMASCSHCGRKTAYSKNEGLMSGVQKNLDDFRCMVEQNQQTILAGLAALSQQLDEHDKRNSAEHGEQTAILIGIQRDVQDLKNQQARAQAQIQTQTQTPVQMQEQTSQESELALYEYETPGDEVTQSQINWENQVRRAEEANIRQFTFETKTMDGETYSILTGIKKLNSSSIMIPERDLQGNLVTDIGEKAFNNCNDLTNITIPYSVTSIGASAFKGCTGLTSITILCSVTSIERSTFEGCTGLTNITIPYSVRSIGASAFKGCTGLTSITIPYRMEFISTWFPYSIGDSAFKGCTGLTSITIPKSVKIIGNWAFAGCTSLTSITIPDSVTSIEDFAFEGCTGLTSITIPDHVSTIHYKVFSNCTSLTSITIPYSVTSINSYAFENCKNLKDVYYIGSRWNWAAISTTKGHNMVIPQDSKGEGFVCKSEHKLLSKNKIFKNATIHYNWKGK